MKQTAVILIRDWVRTNGNMSDDGKFITYSCKKLEEVIAQAKEMEKEQQGYSEKEVKSFLNDIISEIGIIRENIEKNQDKMPIHLVEGSLIAFESSIDVIKQFIQQFKKK